MVFVKTQHSTNPGTIFVQTDVAFVKTLTMMMSTVIAHDSINLNAECAEGREGVGEVGK